MEVSFLRRPEVQVQRLTVLRAVLLELAERWTRCIVSGRDFIEVDNNDL
jgi:hypothetical protein